jgi:hypothetical protein
LLDENTQIFKQIMTHPADELRQISRQFQIYGELLQAEAFKVGHINATYCATYNQGGSRIRYLHQKLNRQVFKDPEAVMKNIIRVTDHLRRKLERQAADDITRRSLIVIPTRDGQSCCRGSDGEYWRTFVFIEGTKMCESVQSPRQAFEAGKAFGEFQLHLADLPGERLLETIPDFHHTRRRFEALLKAVQQDHLNRAQGVQAEINFAWKREPICDVLLGAMAKGKIPERITHNDTKFNNVLLDRRTGAALCVVDLDTVMPGCALHDFGDMVRATTNSAAEDERDLAKVKMQMPLFKKLAEGYLSAAGGFLNRTERSFIAFSGKLITFETGLRFLTDYLNGDTYFRTHRPGQNLDRCRKQFRLVESIERQENAMQHWADRL